MAALQASTVFRAFLTIGLISSFLIAVKGQFNTDVSCGVDLQPVNGTASTETGLFIIVANPSAYTPGSTVQVFIASSSQSTITGLLIQARQNDQSPVGSFMEENNFVTLACPSGSATGSLTNVNSNDKTLPLSVLWTAPAVAVGDVEFVATIVFGAGIYFPNARRTITGPPPPFGIGACPTDTTVNAGTVSSWATPTCTGSTTTTSTCTPVQGQPLTQDTSVTCSCIDGIGGVQSCTFQITTVTASDPCDSNPCQNNGFCFTVVPNVFSCFCQNGFTGPTCTDLIATGLQCPADFTTNDGTAVQYANPACGVGFAPPMAICSPAASAVFPMGATTVTCSCFGTTTETCQFNVNVIIVTDPCVPSPCQNGGTCLTVGTTFSCRCVGDFTGAICTDPIVPGFACLTNPCFGGNRCEPSSSLAGYTCHSTEGSPCL